MASPTAVNIGIGFDITELRKSSGLARGEIASFLGDVKKAQTDLERFTAKKGIIDSLLGQQLMSPQLHAKLLQYYKDLYNIEQGHNRAAAAAKRHGDAASLVGMLKQNLGPVGTTLAGGLAIGGMVSKATDFAASSVNIAIERQRIEMMLGALTGGAESVGNLTSSIRQLDKQSALSFMEISKGAQTMLGFGVSTEITMPALKALSEISMGNAERFQSLSLAFGQVAASGKLAGQEILQMVNAGFNPLQEISRTTGRTMSDLRRAVSDGEISFLQVAQAIISATEAGGRFFEVNEALMSTLGGRIAKFKSDIEVMKSEFGENLFPTLNTLLDLITDNTDSIQTFLDSVVLFADAVGFFVSGAKDGLGFISSNLPGADLAQSQIIDQQIESLKKQADISERKGDQARAKELRDIAAQMQLGLDKGKLERDSLDKFFDRINEREEKRKEREAKKQEEAQAAAALKADPQRQAALLAEEQEKIRLANLSKETAGIAADIEKERKKLFMTERDILIENLGLNNKVFDQNQRNEALRLLAQFEANQDRKLQEADQKRLNDIIESTNTATDKLQEKIAFVNDMLAKGKISAADAKKTVDALNAAQRKKDQDEQDRRRKQWQEFGLSINKEAQAIEQVKDIMLALSYGFIDAATAQKASLEAVKDLDKEKQLSLENPKAMSQGEQLVSSQKARKVQQNHDQMMKKLEEIRKKAEEQVNELKNRGGFAERN